MAEQKQAAKQSNIYALAENNEIRYIGQAKNVSKRYGQHCSLAQNMGNTRKQKWLKKLILAGNKPTLIILEHTDNADAAEIRWIKHYRNQGARLTNTADGGTTLNHAWRAKQTRPWGTKHSPVQTALMTVKSTIKTFRKFGDEDRAKRLESRYVEMLQAIDKIGRDRMNLILWETNGERYGRTD